MGTKQSIYLLTPERPRDLLARAPEPAPREPLSYYAPTELPRKETEQGNTVHANFVISGSCLRNRGYASNRDVPYRSSLRYNSMGHYTFPRDNTVAANYTHQLYQSLCPHRGSNGRWRWTY